MKKIINIVPVLVILMVLSLTTVGCDQKIITTKDYIKNFSITYYEEDTFYSVNNPGTPIDITKRIFTEDDTIYALIKFDLLAEAQDYTLLELTLFCTKVQSIDVYEANTARIKKQSDRMVIDFSPSNETKSLYVCLRMDFLKANISYYVNLELSDSLLSLASYTPSSVENLNTRIMLEYDEKNDSFTLTKLNDTTITDFTIPSSMYDININKIGEKAFEGCTSLQSVTLPQTITEIGDYAFSQCDSLIYINIPSTVKRIGQGAFYQCPSLVSLTLPFIGETPTKHNFLGYIFGASTYKENPVYISSLKEVVVTNGITNISSYAFYKCHTLTEVTLPSSVEKIGKNVFRGCNSLENLTVPFMAKTIHEKQYLGYLFGAPINLFNSFYVPKSLHSVTLTGRLTKLHGAAFFWCRQLTTISIQNSITQINFLAFYRCKNLVRIDYSGTSSQWTNTTKQLFWDLHTGDYTVRCSDKNVEKE